MNTEVKACILFGVDSNTARILQAIVHELHVSYAQLVKKISVEAGRLPYHMTIIPDIRSSESEYVSDIENILSVLKPFQSSTWVPRVKAIELAELNDYQLGARLKFKAEAPYSITGNRSKNRALIARYSPRFTLDGQPRHISLISVNGALREVDIVKPYLIELLERYEEVLCKMTLSPQVWVKRSGIWRQYR